MPAESDRARTDSAPRFDGHRISEFIYGIVTGLVAVAGIDAGAGISWWGAASIILVGAVAIWLAHAYSTLFARRIAQGHRLNSHVVGTALWGSWPIVVAGSILAVPLIPAAFGFLSIKTALWTSSLVGLALLALVGIFAGVVTKETWPHRVLLAAMSLGLGFMVVVVELAVHH
jgi:hypothetical protein